MLGRCDAVGPFLVAPQRVRVTTAVHGHPDCSRWLKQGADYHLDAIIEYALSKLPGSLGAT